MTQDLASAIAFQVRSTSGRSVAASTPMEVWQGLSASVVGRIAGDWETTDAVYKAGRQEHYFSAEFLMGRALLNNLSNLGLVDETREALASFGIDLSQVLEQEPDAALGNGGLGRLAACFLDSCATLELPVTGYGILYRYGLFKQLFDNGFQTEHPDPWMEEGYPFVIRREEQQRIVRYADMWVRAIPHDMPITGYGTRNVGTLRLWKAEPMEQFDYQAFSSQRFTDAIVERERTSDISRVLYPNDTTFEGKVLRVRQQYFFCSASLQEIVDNYVKHHGENLTDFAKYNSIQLNDTHPVLSIPELMRILLDEHGMGWDEAWKIVTHTFAYTNHTVLAEALERWEMQIFDRIFPRISEIVREIDRRFREDMGKRGLDGQTIEYMAPVSGNQVRMAWIACYASYSINGVAALHTEIIKRETLKEWHAIWPERFNNKTNGVTPRRWLNQCNPRLAALLTEVTGSDAWVKDLSVLANYTDSVDDSVYDRINEIKHANKVDFAAWVAEREGVEIDPDAIFDVQIKRLHEYKRQLLNAFYVLDLYFRLKDDPTLDVPKRVFVFGAKAAPGYILAKAIIKFINEVARLVNDDEDINGRIKVVFVHNYNVSPAEHIIPAADVSEQISMAGKEASGTSNMKFMMNGALTLGTLDGANVEILDAVGDENAYIFGATEKQLPSLKRGYDPRWQYENVPGLKRVVDALTDGTLDDNGSGWFHDLRQSLMEPGWEGPDVYYVLGDFESYRTVKDAMAADHADARGWARKAWVNITQSGRFSSDRTIRDYAEQVWKLDPAPID
ncbi:glycogen/starch/alpha-glucan phosphorylase [Cutibacterium avidum]|uniref:glycogen/starch/alpha-glucan phosphorylase n=1 Tax=Cutibacterium avidum TaxID=33010 RepID=UPI0008F5C5CF|nr:glycogen/starch/alpha-glucan phosphorylase [Cutibacterium avidum]MCO6631997.1 glycogen/starch/alpha-glucan phosphorylase [Cutibacterium avidum]MCO6664306.1 glycogen/starch/alpha-glucan phosphorylase [Cutibacterium avidum]MCT1415486.1 glycogen/starch/alpha-glucan phosphorylase [Cutibacterium avidum]MCX8466208.1 glycogen/starch/alpha-glucan phosphorylase [Cutibacterium avidum]MCX8468481.1 glycogen/starch/alpha-glucan phosphorylase [Cutibacterium avidum]